MFFVNGRAVPFTEGVTILGYLKANKYKIDRIAIELNGKILAKSLYDTTVIQSEDRLEIVCFVGGG
ncbi:MAG: sulfur carrier protein ThiS [Lachnospiraceae bacterium]